MRKQYSIRFRDLFGVERRTAPDATRAAAIRHARVLERHGGTVLAIVTSEGDDMSWDRVEELAEPLGILKPPAR